MPYSPSKHKRFRESIKKHTRDKSTTQKGYGAIHRKWRETILSRDPVCQCKKYLGCSHPSLGCDKPSEEADHINRNTFDRSLCNGQGLCKRCHINKTISER